MRFLGLGTNEFEGRRDGAAIKETGGGCGGWFKGGGRDNEGTVVQNNQENGLEYWATRTSVRLFARTAHSFACSGLLASFAPSAALTRSLTP